MDRNTYMDIYFCICLKNRKLNIGCLPSPHNKIVTVTDPKSVEALIFVVSAHKGGRNDLALYFDKKPI